MDLSRKHMPHRNGSICAELLFASLFETEYVVLRIMAGTICGDVSSSGRDVGSVSVSNPH